MQEKESIIISIPLVWGIRNIILSGIRDGLEQKYNVFFAVPEIGVEGIKKYGIKDQNIIVLNKNRSSKSHQFVLRILREAWRRNNPTKSDEAFKLLSSPSRSFKKMIRDMLYFIISLPFTPHRPFRWLERVEGDIYSSQFSAAEISDISQIRPLFALSTSIVVSWEWPLFRLLHKLEIPIYTHILSFDNLTSRGYFPLSYFDTYLVWNEEMQNELKRFYRIDNERIVITGTPQFDFHVNPLHRRTIDWTFEKLGIERKNYIVYCANHINLTPDEPELVASIIKGFQLHPVLRNYQIILRLHPMDDYDRWAALRDEHPEVRFSYPWIHEDKNHLYWGEPSLEDLVLFSNTLRYSSLVLNIASTISIDAAIHDVPIVCIGFAGDPLSRFNKLYHDYHFSHHYDPIMQSGATPLAGNMDNLLEHVIDSINSPSKLSSERKKLVSMLCGELNGLASNNISTILMDPVMGRDKMVYHKFSEE
jgi:hypothetical protein